MIRIVGPGHILFALGAAGTAVLSFVYGDFALQWQLAGGPAVVGLSHQCRTYGGRPGCWPVRCAIPRQRQTTYSAVANDI